jgi:hypothetical protein
MVMDEYIRVNLTHCNAAYKPQALPRGEEICAEDSMNIDMRYICSCICNFINKLIKMSHTLHCNKYPEEY